MFYDFYGIVTVCSRPWIPENPAEICVMKSIMENNGRERFSDNHPSNFFVPVLNQGSSRSTVPWFESSFLESKILEAKSLNDVLFFFDL